MTMTTILSGLSCPPRFGTARNFDRDTLGGEVGKIAAKLGMPLMPWQQLVADVAYETDDAGQLFYSEVDLTVGRQQGKTSLGLATKTFRCTKFGRQNVVYFAQSRNAARKKWEDEHVFLLEHSSFRRSFEVRKSNGSEAILWKNGSKWGVDAPTRSAGHGDVVDHADIDEAFAHVDDRVEAAVSPAMLTRASSQLWVESTAGDKNSVYLYRKILAGRAAHVSGHSGSVASFEWSAEDDADPGDEGVWWSCMPALGYTLAIGKVRKAWDTAQRGGVEGINLFRRSMLNQWPEIPVLDDQPGMWQVVSPEEWNACRDFESCPGESVTLSMDSTPDRAWSSFAIVSGGHAEIVDHRPGTAWVIDRARDLFHRHESRLAGFAVDPRGPAGSFLPELEKIFGSLMVKVDGQQHARSAGALVDAIRLGELGSFRHRGQPELDAAMASACKRPLGDAFGFARSGVSPISPLIAVVLGRHADSSRSGSLDPNEVFVH